MPLPTASAPASVLDAQPQVLCHVAFPAGVAELSINLFIYVFIYVLWYANFFENRKCLFLMIALHNVLLVYLF